MGYLIIQVDQVNVLSMGKEDIKSMLRTDKRPLVVRFAKPLGNRSGTFFEGIGLAKRKAYDDSDV